MDYTQISIIKRDGKTEPFSLDKIVRAITKAFRAGGITDEGQAVEQIASDVAAAITKAEISVEEIQDMVEERLMKRNPSIAKRYIIYREWRNVERDRRSSIKSIMDGIVTVEKNDINLSNANMSSHTPAGQMMTFASEITKDYALKYLVGVAPTAAPTATGTSTFTTWTTIPPRPRRAFSTIWVTSTNGDSRRRTARCARRSRSRATPRWPRSSSRPTRTSSTAGSRSRRSTISWLRAC